MKATIHGIRIAVLILCVYWTLLTLGTHLPAQVVRGVHGYDKLVHCLAFCGLAFLLAWAVPTNPLRLSQNVLIATFVSVSYAAVDELTQIPVGRTADWGDFTADVFGVLLGLIVYVILRQFVRSKLNLAA
jgi:VanZ family protein